VFALPSVNVRWLGEPVVTVSGENVFDSVGGTGRAVTVSVDVAGDDAGTYVNTIAAGALHTTLGDNAAPASATLIVTPVETSDRIFCDGFDGVACAPTALDAANAHVAPKAAAKRRSAVGDRRLR
jgi:hypothetical protein